MLWLWPAAAARQLRAGLPLRGQGRALGRWQGGPKGWQWAAVARALVMPPAGPPRQGRAGRYPQRTVERSVVSLPGVGRYKGSGAGQNARGRPPLAARPG